MYRAVRVIISGGVQGVGFRAFVERQAKALALDGWVRNLRDGTVEAVIAGRNADVHTMLDLLQHGPPSAHVAAVAVEPFAGEVHPGFEQRHTP
jgi:acylphosphatase